MLVSDPSSVLAAEQSVLAGANRLTVSALTI